MKKPKKLDDKNCAILRLLQENCRMSLTEISRNVGLSVDSVKKRINKMINENVFFPKIQLRPRNFGYNNVVDIKIKIQNYNEEEINEFITYLKEHPRVVELFSIAGDWNFSIVIIAKDALEQGRLTEEIRNRFSKIIAGWSESLTTKAYKFEEYDMTKLME
ncbi:AsnC family transcriptional regulator [Candidatus Woesearchaeota archaeon]|jgi:Lrp/AsnC family transcriptional regulator|nr:AsnC family transcriptional regulator [Candidatus Woesearchaeota archaeon]